MDARFDPVDPTPHNSAYSGTTIHHYVADSEPGDEDARDLSDEVEQGGADARAAARGRPSREARDVEDVIRRHAMRRYREEMDGGGGRDGHGGLTGLTGVGMAAGATGRTTTWTADGAPPESAIPFHHSVKSIPPLYKTPKKKKKVGDGLRESNEVRRKKGKASPVRKKTRGRGQGKFGFLGNLFSSGDMEAVSVSIGAGIGADERTGQGERDGTLPSRRPPMLVVEQKDDVHGKHRAKVESRNNGQENAQENTENEKTGADEEGQENEEDLVSPLMVMSPGLSCGGLLDEKFVEAMRGAEDAGPSDQIGTKANDDAAAREGTGDNDDALLQALSPRSLLASPRVVRRLSGITGNQDTKNSHGKEAGKGDWEQDGKRAGTTHDRDARDVTTATRSDGKKVAIDRSYDEEQVYQLMQQVKAQQAKILELEEKAHQKVPRSADHRRHRDDPIEDSEQRASHPSPARNRQEERRDQFNKSADQAPFPGEQTAPPSSQSLRLGPREDSGSADALLSRMDETLQRIKAESDERIRRAESQHASKLEGLEEAFEAKLKVNQKTWDDERAELLKKCAELEESNKETKQKLESMTKDKEAVDEQLESMKQRMLHLEEEAANAEERVGEAVRQKALIEDTSMALANQIAVLSQRAQSAEKSAESAQQELQVQQAAMKTRVSTVESLNQEIQRLTRENSRLIGDKSSMEEHVRRLTSILHTVMTPTVGGGVVGGLNGTVTAGMATMGGPVQIPEGIGMPLTHGNHLGVGQVEDGKDPTAEDAPSRKPLAPHNSLGNNDNLGAPPKTSKIQPPKPIEQMTPKEAKAYKETRTAELDKELMDLNMEKEQLDQELARMPVNSGGKTVAQRRRKKLVENRLDELFKEIGRVKRELRNMKRDVILS